VTVGEKLQLRAGQGVAVIGLPDGVELELPDGVSAVDDPASADAVVSFLTTSAELADAGQPVLDAARRDALAWLAYPKGGQLGTDLNRDVLREGLEAEGVQPVRQVAIDVTWSALRLRPA
jgi:phage-related baseplate assembly protein